MTQQLNDLVVKHIPLVKKIANKLGAPSLKDDLVGEGMVALVKIANSFDPSRGIPFGVFAKKRIKGAMINYLRKNVSAVSLDDSDEEGTPYQSKLGNDGQIARYMLRDELAYYLHPIEEWVIVRKYLQKAQLNDIAAELGFKVTRVNQIHSNALTKLKTALAPAEVEPQEEGDDDQAALLQVVKRMFWDEWGLEVTA